MDPLPSFKDRHSLSRLAFTAGKRLEAGAIAASNYAEFKVVCDDGAVMQLYADGSCLCYRKLVNGTWATIGRIAWGS